MPFPFPRGLPHPGIEPGSTALQADSLPTESLGKPAAPRPLFNIAKISDEFFECMRAKMVKSASVSHVVVSNSL